MTYNELLGLFENEAPNIDETAFYFTSDPEEYDPYWQDSTAFSMMVLYI